MSKEVKERPDRADAVQNQAAPGFTDEIQRHLGSLLAAVYAQDDTERSSTDRFADLLIKLDAALGEAANRDDAAFKSLLVATVPALRRFAISLARDPTAADDLVQDTLLRAWRARARFEPGTNFEAWTFTILRNLFYSGQRRRREVQDEDGGYTARLSSPPDQAGRLDLQDMRAALDRLAPTMREAVVLVAIENLSYEEAAAVMNCQVGTVKSRVWRARSACTSARLQRVRDRHRWCDALGAWWIRRSWRMSQDPAADREAAPAPSFEQIRERAHVIWERHHRPEGFEVQFWLMAERKLKAERKAMPKQGEPKAQAG